MQSKMKILWMTLAMLMVCSNAVLATSVESEEVTINDPQVMISSYEIEDGSLTTGKTNLLTVGLGNMSNSEAVYNVVITFEFSSKSVIAEYGTSNQMYIERIKPEEVQYVVMPLLALDSVTDDFVTGTLTIGYTAEDRKTYKSVSKIQIPLNKDKLSIYRTDIPSSALLNEEVRASIIFENTGTSDIYNVMMTVKGSAMEDKSLSLGTVQSSGRKNEEVYISFDSVGEQYASVEFTYEDSSGNEYITRSQSQRIDVIEQRETETSETDVPQTEVRMLSQREMVYVAGLIVTGGLMIAVVLWKRR